MASAMANLLGVDLICIRATDLLNAGQRAEAIALLEDGERRGVLKDPGQELLRYLRTATRGRQPFGAKHRWIEIGEDNEALRDRGVPYEERLDRLSVKYRLGDRSKVATAIATYEKAREIGRDI